MLPCQFRCCRKNIIRIVFACFCWYQRTTWNINRNRSITFANQSTAKFKSNSKFFSNFIITILVLFKGAHIAILHTCLNDIVQIPGCSRICYSSGFYISIDCSALNQCIHYITIDRPAFYFCFLNGVIIFITQHIPIDCAPSYDSISHITCNISSADICFSRTHQLIILPNCYIRKATVKNFKSSIGL